jgi:SAM-dependent methyltransferase
LDPPGTFTDRLHVLRERELRKLPPGARTVLHGGAAGAWYFRWFEENYAGEVQRHIGVDYLEDAPRDLPPNVEWLKRTLGDMGPVADGSVDMVFAGQVIEHLWPDDVAGFLLESRRVLRDRGFLVIDSPNRRVTEAIEWLHPQHTAELSVDEIAALVRLAGFDLEAIRGVLLGYDADDHVFLGIDDLDADMPWEERAARAVDRPEDAFVWWLVARPTDRAPRAHELRELAHELGAAFRAARLRRLQTPLEVKHTAAAERVVARDDGGALFHGPYFPVDSGDWRVTFQLRAPDVGSVAADMQVAWIDAATEAGKIVHARRDLTAGELRADGGWTAVSLDLTLDEMLMGVELRALAFGTTPVEAKLQVCLEPVAARGPAGGGRHGDDGNPR